MSDLPPGIITDFTPSNPEFADMLKSHFNEPIIISDRIARLIGYAEDDCDCYLGCVGVGGATSWNTAVGGNVFLDRLKGQGHVVSQAGEHWDDLTRLDSLLALNNAPKAEAFLTFKDLRPTFQPEPTLPIGNIAGMDESVEAATPSDRAIEDLQAADIYEKADFIFEDYDFECKVEDASGWERNSADNELSRKVYLQSADSREGSIAAALTVKFDANHRVLEAYCVLLHSGNLIGKRCDGIDRQAS